MSQYGSTLLFQDAAGNLTGYGSKTFGYDSANRMSLVINGGTTATYRYNGFGQRTIKQVTAGSVETTTHYDYGSDGRYLAQTQLNADGTNAQRDEYIWLDDPPIAQVHTVYGTNNAIAGRQVLYIHADHLNTPRAMSDATKKVVWKWEGEAYGRNAPNGDPDGDGVAARLDLRFPGQIADAETGFFNSGFRYYDPVTGRFTQVDPIGVARDYSNPVLQAAMRAGLPLTRNRHGSGMGLNQPYAYVDNNSLRYVDPFGLENGDIIQPGQLDRWNTGDSSAFPSTTNNSRYKSCYESCAKSVQLSSTNEKVCTLVAIGVDLLTEKMKSAGIVTELVCVNVSKAESCSKQCSDNEKNQCRK